MEDRKIIDLYFKRDEHAIEETEKKYGHYCFTTAYNILFNREDCQECVNDTWHKTWNLIPPNRPKILKYFLAKITRNLALNLLRKNTADKRGGLESEVVFEELENVLGTSSNPKQEYHLEELKELINRFLSKQKDQYRNVFVRRYFYFESIQKIALRYGLSESNVSVILNRMRADLKEMLQKEDYL